MWDSSKKICMRSNGKSVTYKTKIVGKIPVTPPQLGNDGDANWLPQSPVPILNVEVIITLDLPLINC